MKKTNKFNSHSVLCSVVVATFFFVLIVFFAGSILLPDREYSETENRNLSSFPVVSIENILSGRFMSELETYLSDQFINRDIIVTAKTLLSQGIGNKEVNDVYIGKNNRLFEVPSKFDENNIQEKAEIINDFAEKYNIENKYFILVPNATHIITDMLPDGLTCDNQETQINYFYDLVKNKFECIDTVASLNLSDNKDKLYFYTDHHWTSEAAKLVFDSFAEKASLDSDEISYLSVNLSKNFSGTLASSSGIEKVSDYINAIVPENIEGTFVVHNYDTQTKKTTFFEKDKLKNKNQYEVFFGGNFSRLRIFTDNVNGKNLLIFKDSYANCFIPLLIPHYENIIIIDPRYFSGNIEDVMADYNYTDMLFLYNLNTFIEDTSLKTVIG